MAMNAEANTDKNLKLFNPLKAPELYVRHFHDKERSITLRQQDESGGRTWRFETLSEIDDPKTGFKAAVVLDKASGHAIILYKGMDAPLKDEGNGRFAFLRDAFTAAQSWFRNGVNQQTRQAERLYIDTLIHPDVKSLEVIGFSLGTLHANYVTAKFGAKGTVIADLGLPENQLTALFNERARLNPGHEMTPRQMERQMNKDLTVLRLRADLVPAFFKAGPNHGHVIDLDKGSIPDLPGLGHLAAIYNQSAEGFVEREPARTASVANRGIQYAVPSA